MHHATAVRYAAALQTTNKLPMCAIVDYYLQNEMKYFLYRSSTCNTFLLQKKKRNSFDFVRRTNESLANYWHGMRDRCLLFPCPRQNNGDLIAMSLWHRKTYDKSVYAPNSSIKKMSTIVKYRFACSAQIIIIHMVVLFHMQ